MPPAFATGAQLEELGRRLGVNVHEAPDAGKGRKKKKQKTGA